MTSERGRMMGRASHRPGVVRVRHEDAYTDDEYARAKRDLLGMDTRRVVVENLMTGEELVVVVGIGRCRVNQYRLDDEDGLDRRKLGDALLRVMGL